MSLLLIGGCGLSKSVRRKKNILKGKLFEIIVRILLKNAGYIPITPDGVHIRRGDGKVRGRGYWHDIDALGRFWLPLFFMYPIRLLAEAKYYEKKIGLGFVRNFVGALKDIAENYFVDDKLSPGQIFAYQRYTDCGSFFSVSGFTRGAQRYALAQGVFLISYQNNPIFIRIVDLMEIVIDSINLTKSVKELKDYEKWIKTIFTGNRQILYGDNFVKKGDLHRFSEGINQLRQELDSIETSTIAMIITRNRTIQYPVHILSYQRIPEELFRTSDEQRFRVHFTETPRGLLFELRPVEAPQVRLYFSLPRDIYRRYFEEGRMPEFKRSFLREIEMPMTLGGIRRVLNFKLDLEWIRGLEEQNRD